ncbi:MAG: reverse transcriptase family protein [Candidatus Thiodiazotropha sp.]
MNKLISEENGGGEILANVSVNTKSDKSFKCFCGDSFQTARGLGQHKRQRHATEVVQERQEKALEKKASYTHVCFCGDRFATAIGLGQHKRQKHPIEVNAERQSTLKSSSRWTKQESEILVRLADENARKFTVKTQLYMFLSEHFDGRSITSIKNRLISLKWKAPLPTIREEVTVQAHTELLTCAWRVRMLDNITNVLHVNKDERIRSDILFGIADCLRQERIDVTSAKGLLETHARTCFPHLWKMTDKQKYQRSKTLSKPKEIRRANYAAIQALYHQSRKDAVKSVLSGNWRTAYKGRTNLPEETEEYWRSVFETPSKQDNRCPMHPREVIWSIIDPITEDEVVVALREMSGSAAGLDRLSVSTVKRIKPNVLAQYFNLLLVIEAAPKQLSNSRITLIPKGNDPTDPANFRPIAVSSVFIRALHKILAKRWLSAINIDSLQVAFQKRDGCLEATSLLHTVLRHVHEKGKSAAIAFLDVSKAFDSISHDTILRGAYTFGAPEPLIMYLSDLYKCQSQVVLNDTQISCTRGVRQGDPLSPLLFICAIEEVLKSSDERVGFDIDNLRLSTLAYADDLVVFAENSNRLREKLLSIERALDLAGMQLNPKKSHSLTIAVDGLTRKPVLLNETYKIGGSSIIPMSAVDEVHYLGLDFTWKGKVKKKHTAYLEQMLTEVHKAPLKPYQRIEIVREFLIPKFTHELVLGNAHRNTLRAMDLQIRQKLRQWLRLPRDVKVDYFYSHIEDGGLGIPCLNTAIPLQQRSRLEKLLSSTSLFARTICEQSSFAVLLRRANIPVRVNNQVVHTKAEVRAARKEGWLTAHDGIGLDTELIDASSHAWVKKPGSIFPRLHIRGIHLRCGALRTKCRSARGRNVNRNDVLCRGLCGLPETLNHILQTCAVTHDARCSRHNRIVRLIEKKVGNSVDEILVEPIVRIPGTYLKPDVVVRTGGIVRVFDVTVVAGGRVEQSWQEKVSKYGTINCEAGIKSLFPTENNVSITHTPVVVTNRGLLYHKSATGLRKVGFSQRDLSDLCLLAIRGTLSVYDLYMRGTGPGIN